MGDIVKKMAWTSSCLAENYMAADLTYYWTHHSQIPLRTLAPSDKQIWNIQTLILAATNTFINWQCSEGKEIGWPILNSKATAVRMAKMELWVVWSPWMLTRDYQGPWARTHTSPWPVRASHRPLGPIIRQLALVEKGPFVPVRKGLLSRFKNRD